MSEETHETERQFVPLPRCPYCHDDVAHGDALRVCTSCHAFHHQACWSEHEGCASCDPGRARPIAPGGKAAPRPAGSPRLRLAVVAGVVLLGVIFYWLDSLRTTYAPRPSVAPPTVTQPVVPTPVVPPKVAEPSAVAPADGPGSPCAAVQDYLEAAHLPTAKERAERLVKLLDFESGWLFACERWETREPVAVGTPLREEPGTTPTSAVVLAGSVRFELVKEYGTWRVDRQLLDDPTEVLGVSIRLPFGLLPRDKPNSWTNRSLTLRAWRAPDPTPKELDRVRTAETSADATFRGGFEVDGMIAGWRVRTASCRGDDENASVCVVYDGSTDPLWFVWKYPAKATMVEGVLNRSLASIVAPGNRLRPPDSALPKLVSRNLNEGFSILGPAGKGAETIECTCSSTDLESAIAAAREWNGEKVSELRLPNTLLSWRALYRVPDRWDKSRATYVLKAVGRHDEQSVVLKISTPAVSPSGDLELLRLTAIVESMKPLPPEVCWPAPSLRVDLPEGANGTIQEPEDWREASSSTDMTRLSWCGYAGDIIELLVSKEGESILGGEKVATIDVGHNRRLVVVAYANSESRLRRVADVARACVATLKLTPPK